MNISSRKADTNKTTIVITLASIGILLVSILFSMEIYFSSGNDKVAERNIS
jgi:hypothetical protein